MPYLARAKCGKRHIPVHAIRYMSGYTRFAGKLCVLMICRFSPTIEAANPIHDYKVTLLGWGGFEFENW